MDVLLSACVFSSFFFSLLLLSHYRSFFPLFLSSVFLSLLSPIHILSFPLLLLHSYRYDYTLNSTDLSSILSNNSTLFLVYIFRSLRVPSFLIFGQNDTCPGAGIAAAEELHALLSDRLSEVITR